MLIIRVVGGTFRALVSALPLLLSTAAPDLPPSVADPLLESLRFPPARVAALSKNLGKVSICQGNPEQAARRRRGWKGLPKGVRVLSAKKTAQEQDAVSLRCHATLRDASESLHGRSGPCNRLRHMSARHP